MFRNSEGKRVPEVTFRSRQDGRWKDVSTKEIFTDRTVVLFALPGALEAHFAGKRKLAA